MNDPPIISTATRNTAYGMPAIGSVVGVGTSRRRPLGHAVTPTHPNRPPIAAEERRYAEQHDRQRRDLHRDERERSVLEAERLLLAMGVHAPDGQSDDDHAHDDPTRDNGHVLDCQPADHAVTNRDRAALPDQLQDHALQPEEERERDDERRYAQL